MRSGRGEAPGTASKSDLADLPTTAQPPPSNSPMTFFLRSEGDMNRMPSAGTNDSTRGSHITEELSAASSFGVQSLADTLRGALSEDIMHSQADNTDHLQDVPAFMNRKKNSIHPKIFAAAQRIISPHRSSTSPARSNSSSHRPRYEVSPSRRHPRSASIQSRSRAFASPRPSARTGSGVPSTPLCGSVRSLGLSDEEGSILDDCASQAVQSSSEDEDTVDEDAFGASDGATPGAELSTSGPQLVMPSLSMPKRRPFTDRGKNMGKLKVLVTGLPRVGKTNFIRSVIRACPDIVHVDHSVDSSARSSQNWLLDVRSHGEDYVPTSAISEINASTKPYPQWKRRSIGGAALERNICIVDTPGCEMNTNNHDTAHSTVPDIFDYLQSCLRRNTNLGHSDDPELLDTLSGGGGAQVDAIIYIFPPGQIDPTPAELDYLRRLSALSNLVPVIGKADICTAPDDLKASLSTALEAADVKWVTFQETSDGLRMPYAVSSHPGDDHDVMDASLLMSPEYSQPLVPSDLPTLADQLFDPDNIRWLRHCAVKKFIRWRKEHLDPRMRAQMNEVGPLAFNFPVRSWSDVRKGHDPQALDWSMFDRLAFKRVDTRSGMYPPVSITGWAEDLERALATERRWLVRQDGSGRKMIMHKSRRSRAISSADDELVLFPRSRKRQVCMQCSGGDAEKGSVNAQDPLGVLALGERVRRRGWLILRVLGGCSVLATMTIWVTRNWSEVAEWLGLRATAQHEIAGYVLLPRDDWRSFVWGDE
ncbi:hypothetical protein AAFC00_001822 [Neodothiora populina]|uniref:Septin-type G domain-containing protein n=1 Tax=Neodothiora populina TaxID=2781224 RepID=A0ABR3PQE7_9PEZI